ncbi:ejaculatory bulb-specific protein 3-like [Anthonomus grandis grandis]|uniref:ejaculatory bulb-specific protein 3-like n=1 Tax=Anthonomus grandis grandis TaxID=2921223 RepID=UPI002166729B|nr:ejaculatory bulb-specific protein 3-like [Anthonomus grandis grandis]
MKMHTSLILAVLVVNVAFLTHAEPAEKSESTTRAPISDEALEKTLSDKRYLQRQLKCAVGEAPCDSVGRRLKSLAPLVLRGSCPQCTDQEQKQIKKVLAYVQVNFPKEWSKMLKTYAG